MSKQNFISKEFFVHASEKNTQQALQALPQLIQSLKPADKAATVFTTNFIYSREGCEDHCVTVSLLPLDTFYTNVTLHVSYVSGNVFYKDNLITNSLTNLECALKAAIDGNEAQFKPQPLGTKKYKKMFQFVISAFFIAGTFLVWRKLSN